MRTRLMLPGAALLATAFAVPVLADPHQGLQIHVASTQELTELRVKTDRTRMVNGQSQPVYELRKPGSGNTFFNVRLEITSPDPFVLSAVDVQLTDPEGTATATIVDWFQEDGLKERRGDPLSLPAQALLNVTFDAPASAVGRMTVRIGGNRVGSVREVESGDAETEFILAEIQELKELRIQTDKTRVVNGQTQPVYTNRTPKAGSILVNARVYVDAGTGKRTLRSGDIRVIVPGSESGPYAPFDWFQEKGLEEVRGASLVFAPQGIVQFTIEIPGEARGEGRLMILDQDLGKLGDLLP